ncbi:MAG: DUF4282 domain-containing protein [Trueperaceae bacterium]|nr:DUF4282 domain-containing protein [Trueperaceae bacterium]MCO5173053.1 DUF4282 domain-containing protein [Trueperaceae bacterium]MCO5175346.1 DUF4282 domain-containing protein [Trueperaceae bacterium]MCW5820816.1 DUF4282 domain-containing protein [Trueperaceae bacterium]
MDSQSFFSKLFDMSFTQYVTPSIIRIIFVLSIVMAGIAAIGVFTTASTTFGGAGVLLGLLLAVVGFILYVVFARMGLEVVIALFRIAENTRVIADNARRSNGSGD